MSKQMGMSKEMSMPKEMSMSSHGGATLLTLSNYPLQVHLCARNVSQRVLYRSQDACDSVERDVQMRLSQLTNEVNQRLNLEGRRQ